MSDAPPTPNESSPPPSEGASVTANTMLEGEQVVEAPPAPTPRTVDPPTKERIAQFEENRENRRRFPWGFLIMILMIAGIVGLAIWLSKKRRKQMEAMCGGIADWAQKTLCMQQFQGSSGGRRGRGRSGFNVSLF